MIDRSAVHVRLLRLFASPSYRPPLLPGVAQEVIRLAQRPDVSFREVTSVLERDQVLAAKVLSISQSAMYRGRNPALTLQQATIRLGLSTLRNIVVEASLYLKVFNAPGYESAMARLSWHSIATAYIMRTIARRTGIDPDYAFLCGLLHDIGIAACLLALSDDARGKALPFEELGPVLDEVHQEASGMVTRLWSIPPEIQQLTATHHQLRVGGTPHKVNATLIVAEQLAADLDAGMQPRDAPPPVEGERVLDASAPGLFQSACEFMNLSGPALQMTRLDAADVVAKLPAHPFAARPAEPRR
jgi:HD-like signal output (HDOD) protein